MRGLIVMGLVLGLSAGCATREQIYGCGCFSVGEPIVTLTSVTQADESPARGAGYPLLSFPLPAYPPDFARMGITGEVTVRVIVGKNGRVEDAKITKSSYREFESPVLAAVKSWRFSEIPEAPHAELKGLIVDCRFQFTLE